MRMSLTRTTLTFLSLRNRKDNINIRNERIERADKEHYNKISFLRNTGKKNTMAISSTSTSTTTTNIKNNVNLLQEEELFWQDRQGSNTESRIVASSDGKIPHNSNLSLPSSSILNSKDDGDNILLDKLNTLFHAYAYNQSKTIIQNDGITVDLEEKQKQTLSLLKKSLKDGGYEILTKRGLDLCEALNAAYLLRLSILPDLKKLNPYLGKQFYNDDDDDHNDDEEKLLFDGKVLIFRRGYDEEVTTGRLLLPKIDYLQASIVQRSVSIIKKLLSNVEREMRYSIIDFLEEIINNTPVLKNDNNNNNTFSIYVKEQLQYQKEYLIINDLDNLDISDRLNPFLVCEMDSNSMINNKTTGRKTDNNKISYVTTSNKNNNNNNGDTQDNNNNMYANLNNGTFQCIYDQRLNNNNKKRKNDNNTKGKKLLKRIDITNLVDFFSMDVYNKNLIEGFLSYAKLVEPTYKEIIVIWQESSSSSSNTENIIQTKVRMNPPPDFVYKIAQVFDLEEKLPKKHDSSSSSTSATVLTKPSGEPLKIRAFKDVPMANLLAVLPKTKLIFRQADALVFDSISLISLIAVLASQKYDNPKVDLIAFISVILWLLRTFFRYSNKFARYDLLVNKFLTSRIAYSDDGAIRYLIDEGADQKARKVALVYNWLLHLKENEDENSLTISKEELTHGGEKELNQLLNHDNNQWININIEGVLQELEELNIIKFSKETGLLVALKDPNDAMMILREKWVSLF